MTYIQLLSHSLPAAVLLTCWRVCKLSLKSLLSEAERWQVAVVSSQSVPLPSTRHRHMAVPCVTAPSSGTPPGPPALSDLSHLSVWCKSNEFYPYIHPSIYSGALPCSSAGFALDYFALVPLDFRPLVPYMIPPPQWPPKWKPQNRHYTQG